MNQMFRTSMSFYKEHYPDLIYHMNTIFLYTQFNFVKHIHYPALHNVFLGVKNGKYCKLSNIPTDMYTVKFPEGYDFARDMVITNRDITSTFNVHKSISLDVYNETNEFIGYYKQDLDIEYVSIDELRIKLI